MNIKYLGIIGIIAVAILVFTFSTLFTITGSTTEKITNTQLTELRLHPTVFQDYCFLRTCGLPTNYANVCNRNEGTAGDYGANCPTVHFTGAERKLIGSFCTAEPVFKVYSVSANIHAGDYFGRRTYPDFAIGTTDNLEKSNENTEILYTSPFYEETSYPTRDIDMNTIKLTEAIKGKSCFNLYAIGGGYKQNIPYGMDITVNHLDINYDPVECLPTDTEEQIKIACDDNDIATDDICYNYECQNVPIEITEKPTPEPTGFSAILDSIWTWILGLFENIKFTIIGEEVVKPGETHTYNINMNVNTPDHDYTDGTYETQYAYWALIDHNKNIVQGDDKGVEIQGSFVKDVTITVPRKIDDYMLIGVITQIDSVYNLEIGNWENGEEIVVLQEAINLKTEAPSIMKPVAGGLSGLLDSIISWIKSLFGW